ncbi:testis-specific gene 10 protein-like [Haliotis rufescens]|uniref:testis-specific gene 10 protein-like n=1 Tax=Haliotis rufescens TaxID=6454 RepID=UPI00201EB5F3|nr:testis-specific gene 10 protein-like [Haliotis rufescens]
MFVAVLFLCILLSGSLCGLIMPMTKPDGSADLTGLLNHVTLLEQTVASLQTDVQTNKAQAAAEISSLKDEVASLKTELRVSSNDLAVVKGELNDMKRRISDTNSQPNNTEVDSIRHDVRLHSAQINAVQSDVRMFDNQLNLVNSTVYDVKIEADRFIQNISSDVKLITHEQEIQNLELQLTKTLTQSTSKQLERLEKDMNSTSAGLHDIQNNFSLTRTEVTTLRNNLSIVQKQSLDNNQSLTHVSQDLHLVSADVHAVQNNLSLIGSEVKTVRSDLYLAQNQSLDNKQLLTVLASKNRTVAFHVYFPPNKSPAYTPLAFSGTNYNAGSTYNTTTGKFTAPVNGTYMFWTQIEARGSTITGMYVHIMKSGEVDENIAGGYVKTDPSIDEADASAVTVTHLDQGEEAWVETDHSGYIYQSSASYFGGVLLSED